jgi:hypothetical protein
MQYMLLIYGDEKAQQGASEEQQREEFGRWMAYTEDLKKAEVMVAGDALQPIATATSVRIRDGERIVTDGPFAETKEQLGGYYLLDCKDLDEALGWAAKCPGAFTGTIEVRPVMVFE